MKAAITLLHSFPGYDVVRREPMTNGATEIFPDEALGLPRNIRPRDGISRVWQQFSASSVITYAQKNNKCPIMALDRARKNGHELHWLSPQACVITDSQPSVKPVYVQIEVGMIVKFTGRFFMIKAAPNDNLELIDIEEVLTYLKSDQFKVRAA